MGTAEIHLECCVQTLHSFPDTKPKWSKSSEKMKVIEGLEHLIHEEAFLLPRRRTRRRRRRTGTSYPLEEKTQGVSVLIKVYKYLTGMYNKDEAILFSVVPNERQEAMGTNCNTGVAV